jgi:hypothetical protein
MDKITPTQQSDVNADTILQQQQEIAELKATVNALRRFIENMDNISVFEYGVKGLELLAKTPEQHLEEHDTATGMTQPIKLYPNGVVRFKSNELVDALFEHGCKTGLSMNELFDMNFTNEDRMQFAQLLGYSVFGYCDLSYVSEESAEYVTNKVEKIMKEKAS